MVKFETKFNPKTSKKINDMLLKRLIVPFAAITIIFVLFGVLALVLDLDNGDNTIGITAIVSGILMPPIALLVLRLKQRKNDKSSAFIREETCQTFTFEKDKFTIETSTGNVNSGTLNTSSSESSYDVIYRITERSDSYLVYVSANRFYVVFKDDITCGSIEELNDIFHEKVGPKFKARTKK